MFVLEQKDPAQFDFSGLVTGVGVDLARPGRARPAGPFRLTHFTWGEGFAVLRAKHTQGGGSQPGGPKLKPPLPPS